MNASDKDRFIDELLEASLRHRQTEAPRAGLEARILARVRARQQASRRAAWVWTFGAAGAVLAALVMVLALAHREAPPTVNQAAIDRRSFPSTKNHGQGSAARGPEVKSPTVVTRAASVAPKPPRRAPRTAVAPRRPEQFPTPGPLSEEEKLLLAYAAQLPIADLDKLADKNLETEPLEIPGIKIARIEIEELPKLNE